MCPWPWPYEPYNPECINDNDCYGSNYACCPFGTTGMDLSASAQRFPSINTSVTLP